MPSQVDRALPILSLILSLLSLFIILLMTFNPPPMHEVSPWRKPSVGVVFSLICILGILAAVSPKRCSRALHGEEKLSNITYRKIKGHHPDCEAFSTHVIKMGGRTLCAACTGLFTGGVMALTASTLYFSGLWGVEGMELQLILIGILGVAQIFLKPRLRATFRILANALFPIGASLVLIGVDGLFKSLFASMFLNALIVFWIMTRIIVSNWRHLKICFECKSPCGFSGKTV